MQARNPVIVQFIQSVGGPMRCCHSNVSHGLHLILSHSNTINYYLKSNFILFLREFYTIKNLDLHI